MKSSILVLVTMMSFVSGTQLAIAQTTVYSTGFERSEGYDPEITLIGQGGWVGYGTGGNGILTNFLEGLGQQAYIGYTPPEDTNSNFFSVFRPVNVAPIPAGHPVIKFSVIMQIVDSSTPTAPRDDFRWSVYNTNGMRLFSLDFDNHALAVSYLLDNDAGFVEIGPFDNFGYYDLAIYMNFARNLWSATLNDVPIVTAQPITTQNAPLNLGDIDAVWSLRDPAAPGDNYLLFDEYTVTIEPGTAIPSRVEFLGFDSSRQSQIRLYGEPGLAYRLETSSDFKVWTELLTFTAPSSGILDVRDAAAPNNSFRFYRARQVQ